MQPIDGSEAVSSRLAKVSVSQQSIVLAFVLAAGALLMFVGLGNRDFWPPDEPRYGAIAEELRSFVHGWRGLVLLHLNGAVYTQKPPLFFWLAALGGAPFGRVSEAAARLPSALAGFGTLLLVAGLGRSMFRARSGALAALVLLTLPSWLQLARSARLDALLTVFVTLAFAAAWRVDREIGDARRNRLLLHAALGLGVLTKGPVALLLPLLGIVAYLGWERRIADLRRFISGGTAALRRAGADLARVRHAAGAAGLRERFLLGQPDPALLLRYRARAPGLVLPRGLAPRIPALDGALAGRVVAPAHDLARRGAGRRGPRLALPAGLDRRGVRVPLALGGKARSLSVARLSVARDCVRRGALDLARRG